MAKESKNKQIFVVTHDTDILSGIINSGEEFSVIRIDSKREISVFNFDRAAINRIGTSRKLESAIGVLFHDCAIYVEGINDEYVYSGAIDYSNLLPSTSIKYVPCGGNDKVAPVIKISYEVKIPSVVIVDFDTLYEKTKGGTGTRLEAIVATVKSYLSEAEDMKELQSAVNLIKEIVTLIPLYNKDKRLGLLAGFGTTVDSKIGELISILNKHGIFLVPNGSLESWFTRSGYPEERLRKYQRGSNTKYVDLKKFLGGACSYLKSKV